MAEDFKNSGIEQANEKIKEDLERVGRKNERLEKKIENMAEESEKSEEALRKLMGDEQRALVLEAEQKMQGLRETISDAEKKLSDAEADAYENRQRCMDMSETCNAAESQAMSSKQQIDELMDLHQRTEAQLAASHEENTELKELCELAEQRADMEAKAARKRSGKIAGAVAPEELEKIKAEHKKELATKNARIEKLEAVRLTKEQCAALKKMKAERVQFQQQAIQGEKTIAVLKSKLRSSGVGSTENDNNNNKKNDQEVSGHRVIFEQKPPH